MPNETQQHVHVYCPIINPSLSTESRPGTATASGAQPIKTPSSIVADVPASRFQMSFEQAFERLELLPRMFIELDGSFVWSGQQGADRWQIDGMLYDCDERLQRVELAGHAPRQTWEQLLDIFGQPVDVLTIHCLQQQQFVDAAEFLSREF